MDAKTLLIIYWSIFPVAVIISLMMNRPKRNFDAGDVVGLFMLGIMIWFSVLFLF